MCSVLPWRAFSKTLFDNRKTTFLKTNSQFIGDVTASDFDCGSLVQTFTQMFVNTVYSIRHTYRKTTPTSSVPAAVKSFHKTNQLERSSVSFAIFCVDDTSGKHMA